MLPLCALLAALTFDNLELEATVQGTQRSGHGCSGRAHAPIELCCSKALGEGRLLLNLCVL
jgi:hypothetical protein